jgi:hypothetical protein
MSSPSSGSEQLPSSELLIHTGFLLGLFFDTEDGVEVPPRLCLTSNGLQGTISEKTNPSSYIGHTKKFQKLVPFPSSDKRY